MTMRRIDFLKTTGSLLALGFLGAACSDDDSPAPSGGTGGTSGTGGTGTAGTGTAGTGTAGGSGTGGTGSTSCATVEPTIGSNHGHVLTVTTAEVTAAADKTYDIMGTSGHTHSVTITAADFAKLSSGMTLALTSTNAAGHDHAVTVKCA